MTVGATTVDTAKEHVEHAQIAVLEAEIAALKKERDVLRRSHARLREELELLKRRIFIAKAERVDTRQLELQFADLSRRLDALSGSIEADGHDDDGKTKPKRGKAKPKGRRDLMSLALEEERVEVVDPLYEEMVASGRATKIGFETSCLLAHKRGGRRRLVIARAKYQVTDGEGATAVDVAPMPRRTFPRSLAAPSLLAHILMLKFGMGMPLFRIEDTFRRDGCAVDRGTMSRWVEDAGATFGATVVHAMREEAFAQAFCIATDATGVLVQPIRGHEKTRQACRRGHYFVHVADRDHVFLEYTPKETSKAVATMFRGFSGYVQADAKSVYDVLFRDPRERSEDDDESLRVEVGCWAHARRKFWGAALGHDAVAREALFRIGRIFELDASWRGRPPSDIKRQRELHLVPQLQAFFVWAEGEFARVAEERGSLRSAFGYAIRQKAALLRVLDDGRLILDNNRSESALRGTIATGRKAWLFAGSDDHAESAGHIFTLIASCRLHGLDPEAYLRDVVRVLGQWPNDRYLELAPKYWAGTRARLAAPELDAEVGPLTVPPVASEKQDAASAAG